MKRGFVLAVLLLLSATGFAHAGQPPAEPVRVPLPVPPTGPVRLLTFGSQVWEIPLARAATQTRWNLDTGEPLLTLAEAKQTARTWLAGKNPQVEFEMNSVVLQRIRRGP